MSSKPIPVGSPNVRAITGEFCDIIRVFPELWKRLIRAHGRHPLGFSRQKIGRLLKLGSGLVV